MSDTNGLRLRKCQARTLTCVATDFRAIDRLSSLQLSLIAIRSHVQNFANTYLKFLTGANYEPLYIVSSSEVATLPNLCLKTLVPLLKDFDYSPLNKLCGKSQENCWRNPLRASWKICQFLVPKFKKTASIDTMKGDRLSNLQRQQVIELKDTILRPNSYS